MADPTRPSREARAGRRRLERAFRTAELRLWDVEPMDAEAPTPDAVLQGLRGAFSRLDAQDQAGLERATARLALLEGVAAQDGVARRRYLEQHGAGGVTHVRTRGGVDIYRVVATTFPGHENYLYVLVGPQGPVLWDVGSGEQSRADVLRGLRVIHSVYGQDTQLTAFKGVIISHAHVDHFGDAAYFRKATGAPLMVHELDARVLTRFDERVVLAAKDMRIFFLRAGVSSERAQELEAMYMAGKEFFESVEVDRRLTHGDHIAGLGEVIHTPGHCPGHICLRVDNALLVADQVLNPITPNLSPQSITPFNGLENYLHGLGRLRVLEDVDHVLPAHANPIPSLHTRIDEILAHHQERLALVEQTCRSPSTLSQVAQALYGAQEGYNVILALTEAGAHVEYLHQYGRLRVHNLDAVQAQRDPVLEYVTDGA